MKKNLLTLDFGVFYVCVSIQFFDLQSFFQLLKVLDSKVYHNVVILWKLKKKFIKKNMCGNNITQEWFSSFELCIFSVHCLFMYIS